MTHAATALCPSLLVTGAFTGAVVAYVSTAALLWLAVFMAAIQEDVWQAGATAASVALVMVFAGDVLEEEQKAGRFLEFSAEYMVDYTIFYWALAFGAGESCRMQAFTTVSQGVVHAQLCESPPPPIF